MDPDPPPAMGDDMEVDDDTDSSFYDPSTYTESLRSSLLQSVIENGRGYHKYNEGKYILPNDDDECNRLELQHDLFNLTFHNKLILCPAPANLRSCLDIGTGTGTWATEFADLHPECNVIGVDLSAIQPQFAPPNCKWEIDDIEENWTYVQKFDLIHARMMTASFANWPKFFKQSFDALEPGGWLEMQDFCFPSRADDQSMPPTCALAKWNEMMIRGGRISGRGLDVPFRYDEWMREVGFESVTRLEYKWPQNPWPKDKHYKELGRWNLVNMMEGLHGFSIALFTRVLGMSVKEVEDFLVDVTKDVEDRTIHSYWPIYVVYGRKPVKGI